MGIEDRDWYREVQRGRRLKEERSERSKQFQTPDSTKSNTKTFVILIFWLAVLAVLYFGASQYLKPKPITINATGDLVIPRNRDGHFYADGFVN
jgi:hypothetical protein